MRNSLEEKVITMAEPLAKDLGLYIVDVSKKKENGGVYLRIFIDKPEGVGINDCEEFSRAIDPLLDEADLISEAYTLEVSSPGVDRKLTKEREFLYYIGKEVEVKLYKAIDGKKEFSGILKDYKDGIVTIDNISIKKEEAVYIKLYFKM